MERKKLTKTVVDGREPGPKDYVEWCGALTGFGCRVRPSGKRTFIAQYRVGGSSSPVCKFTIGTHGTMTVEEARVEAKRILSNAQRGVDEATDKAKRRAELTVAQLCDEYLAEGCGHKKPSTLATDRGSIARHVKPLLGSKRISEVTKGDIQRFVADVTKGKTAVDEKTKKHGRARVTGGQGAANRTVRLLGGIFTFAIDRGYIEKNPRTGVKLQADKKCERFLSIEELQRLGDTLREAETIGLPWQFNEGKMAKHRPVNAENQREVISEFAVAAVRLLMLTGCRASEILTLKWEHVDPRGFLNLPTSKTGAKVVMLGAPALKVLDGVTKIAGNPYVIVGEAADKPRSDIKRPWRRIIAHAGLPDLRLHDLRHSYASIGAASGMGLQIVGKLLGHASPATTARYAHLADDPQRRAADSIAATIAAAMGAGDAGNVVSIKAAS